MKKSQSEQKLEGMKQTFEQHKKNEITKKRLATRAANKLAIKEFMHGIKKTFFVPLAEVESEDEDPLRIKFRKKQRWGENNFAIL